MDFEARGYSLGFDGTEFGDPGAISWYQVADIAIKEKNDAALMFALSFIGWHEEGVRKNAYCQGCRMCKDLENNTHTELIGIEYEVDGTDTYTWYGVHSIMDYIRKSENTELKRKALQYKIIDSLYNEHEREEAATIIQEWWLKVCYKPTRFRRSTQSTVAESFASDMKRLL